MKTLAVLFGMAAIFFLYSCASTAIPPQNVKPSNTQGEKIPYSDLIEIQKNIISMPPDDVDDFLIEIIPKIQGGITCNDLVEMLHQVNFSDAGKTVKTIAGYVRRPFSEKCFRKISNATNTSDAPWAIFALQTSKPLYE